MTRLLLASALWLVLIAITFACFVGLCHLPVIVMEVLAALFVYDRLADGLHLLLRWLNGRFER